MKKNSFYISFVGLLIITSVVLSCSNKKNDRGGRTDTPTSGTITFYADESFSSIIEEERKQFEYTYPKTHLKAVYTDQNTGMNQLMALKTCLLITSRDLTQGEKAMIQTKQNKAVTFPIGYDGVALIVNRNNPDTLITEKDARRIFSGQVTKWNQLYKNSSLGDIQVVFDNRASGTLFWVEDSLLGGKHITEKNIVAAKSSKGVIDYVKKNPNAIGVVGSNWVCDRRDTNNVTFLKDITVMSVSTKDKATPGTSFKPYQYHLLNGNYPFCRTIYCIVVDPFRALPWSFANYISGPIGQLMILKSGILPYRGDIQVRQVNITH